MRFVTGVLLVAMVGCGSVKAKQGNDGGTDTGSGGSGGPACTANADSCGSDNAVYMCDANGTQETKVQDCQYGCTTDHCNQCQANTTFCSGDNLVQCDAGGSITNPMTCPNGCQNDACNVCVPNVAYCSGSMAITCGANGQPGQTQNCGAAGCQGGVCNSCTPNTTTCNGDTLTVCNSGGTIASTTTCALGCSTSGSTHCKALVPSFGVPAPSGSLPNLAITADSTLDITNCANLSVNLTIGTTTTAVPSTQILNVSQTNGPPICVLKYGTITINASTTLTVTNSSTTGNMLALEATGNFDISGTISFYNSARGRSPGLDADIWGTNANKFDIAPGAGGGGAALAGGNGGDCVACSSGMNVMGSQGGGAVANFASVLTGGSAGGNVAHSGTTYGYGGVGGGGLQLISLTRVTLASTAVISLIGGGGYGPSGRGIVPANALVAAGGGSGGQLVVEAPVVSISQSAIAVSNGGAGAGGSYFFDSNTISYSHYNGQSGQLSTMRAAGGDVPNVSTGDGGFEANGATSPSANGQPSDSGAANYDGGGGGGSMGWIMLKARSAANVMVTLGAVLSPTPTTGAVTAQ